MATKIAILSIKPEFAEKILAQTKTIELRKSTLGLKQGDIIVFYVSVPRQEIALWVRVADIEISNINMMWNKNNQKLGIDHARYLEYFEDNSDAVGIHLGDVNAVHPPITLQKIQILVPGFTPPQGLIWVSRNIFKYQELLDLIYKSLSKEIPIQLPLFNFGMSMSISSESATKA